MTERRVCYLSSRGLIFAVVTRLEEFGVAVILCGVVGTPLELGSMDWDDGSVDVLLATSGVKLDVVVTRNEVALAGVLPGGVTEVDILDSIARDEVVAVVVLAISDT